MALAELLLTNTGLDVCVDYMLVSSVIRNYEKCLMLCCICVQGEKGTSPRRMDRLRRSFRDSFRRRKEHVPESSKPHQWQADEAGVRAGTCNFHVKVICAISTVASLRMRV